MLRPRSSFFDPSLSGWQNGRLSEGMCPVLSRHVLIYSTRPGRVSRAATGSILACLLYFQKFLLNVPLSEVAEVAVHPTFSVRWGSDSLLSLPVSLVHRLADSGRGSPASTAATTVLDSLVTVRNDFFRCAYFSAAPLKFGNICRFFRRKIPS